MNDDEIERELRELLAAGDLKEAGAQCVRVYGRAISWFLIRTLNNAEAAREAFADFGCDLCERLHNAPPPPDLRIKAWLYKLAHNARRRRIRSMQRKQAGFTYRDQETIVQDSLDAFSRQLEHATDLAELARLRMRLDDDERELLALVYDQELTSPEVAALLEITPEAVRTRVRRVKLKLKGYAAV